MSRCFKTGESCQLKNVKCFKLCTDIAKTVCKLNVETPNPFINICTGYLNNFSNFVLNQTL